MTVADENTLREDLEAAIESDGGSAEEETVEVESTATPETEAEETETETEVSAKSGEGAGDADAELAAETPPEPELGAQPPVDWPDEVKAQWEKLDPAVRNTIANRERHVNEVLRESAEARSAVENFQQMIAPYTPLMQAEGVSDPLAAVNGLLQTTATLAMGSTQQKAQKIAALINHYGVDINTLDSILAGEAAPAPAGPPGDPRIDAIWNRMQAAERQAAEQARNEAGQTIQQFAANPANVHFDAVREVMADLLEVADQHGHQMSLEQAYERACMAVPEVATQVIAQRQKQAAQSSSADIASKRSAASSIHGQRSAGDAGGIEEGLSIRETLEAAANLHGSGRI